MHRRARSSEIFQLPKTLRSTRRHENRSRFALTSKVSQRSKFQFVDLQATHCYLILSSFSQVTLHYEEDESEVKVETMADEPERIKCFPLYTILQALNRTHIDLLSLGCQGQELEILQTSKIFTSIPLLLKI